MKPLKSSKFNEVISHFEAWRTTRVGKSKIPAHLWQEAIDLYPSYSISEIIKPLRLGYTDFKKKLSQLKQNPMPVDFIKIEQKTVSTDISVTPQSQDRYQTTTIELEKGDGSRIKIQRQLNDQALLSIINGYFGDESCCN